MTIQASIPFNQQVQNLAKSNDKKADGPMGQEVSALAHEKNLAKKSLNSAILESTISLSAADSPQALVLKTALDGINEALSASLGESAIQNAYDSDLDVSPDATAERIVSLSTAFFASYQEQHPELVEDEALLAFTELIKGGIEKGFSEARDILNGLNVLEDEIASNIDETYELVQTKLNAFVDSFTLED
ncbi:MAG: DUF5610 domain-containing protein [Cycloclasticus sp.]